MIFFEMKINKDAYGQEVFAFFNGEKVVEIVERDDRFIDFSSGPITYFADYKDWSKYEKKAMKFVKGRVLDVGCGAGRVCLYLQKKGFDVIGIDNSPLAIRVCKLRGVKKAILRGIDEVDRFQKNSIDSIVMMGNNFGLFGSFNKARNLLKKMYDITSENALIIAESNDPYKTKVREHLEYQKFNRRRGRMPGQLRIRIRFRKCVGNWIDYLIVSKEEMEEITKGTGWKVKNYINSEKSSYIAIIEKEK